MDPLRATDPGHIGPFRLIGRLGSGGMGCVYLGQSPVGLKVAIKVIQPEFAEDEVFRRRFAREVAAARRMTALHTATVVDADTEAPQPWFATEYVAGLSLAEHVKRAGGLSVAACLTLTAGAAEALRSLHRAGLVHRDVKPGNILLTEQGPKIIDFGIVLPNDTTRLTGGQVMGTVAYMAPERLDGDDGTPSGDVFSLGATIVFAATGHGLLGDGPIGEQLGRLRFGRFNLDGLPAALRPVVVRCCSLEPRDRPTAAELARTVVGLGAPAPEPGWYARSGPLPAAPEPAAKRLPRRTLLLAAGASAAVAGAGAFAWWRRPATGPVPARTTPGPSPSRRAGATLAMVTFPGTRADLMGAGMVMVQEDGPADVRFFDLAGTERWRSPDIEFDALAWNSLLVTSHQEESGRVLLTAYELSSGVRRFRVQARGLGGLYTAGETLLHVQAGGSASWVDAYDGKGRRRWALRRSDISSDQGVCGVVGEGLLVYPATVSSWGGSEPERVICLDIRTRKQRWKVPTPKAPTPVNPDFARVDCGGGGIYYVSRGHGMSALDARTGTRLWTAPPPPAASDAYFATDATAGPIGVIGGAVVRLNPATGKPLWSHELTGTRFAFTSSPDAGLDYLVSGNRFVCLDRADGATVFASDLPDEVAFGTPSQIRVDGDRAHVSFTRSGIERSDDAPNLVTVSLV